MDRILTLHQLLELHHMYARRQSIFSDTRGAFTNIGSNGVFECLAKFKMLKKFVAILNALYTKTSDQVGVYEQLSPAFSYSSDVREGFTISPHLFNYSMNDILSATVNRSPALRVYLLPSENVIGLEYVEEIAILDDSVRAVQQSPLAL